MRDQRMLSLSLSVSLLAPLGCTEDEMVHGLCAKLRTLAADPERVRQEMQGAFCASAFSSAALQQLQGDVLVRSGAATESSLGASSGSPPVAATGGVSWIEPCAETNAEVAETQPEGAGSVAHAA
jgi:hypothetical protein